MINGIVFIKERLLFSTARKDRLALASRLEGVILALPPPFEQTSQAYIARKRRYCKPLLLENHFHPKANSLKQGTSPVELLRIERTN